MKHTLKIHALAVAMMLYSMGSVRAVEESNDNNKIFRKDFFVDKNGTLLSPDDLKKRTIKIYFNKYDDGILYRMFYTKVIISDKISDTLKKLEGLDSFLSTCLEKIHILEVKNNTDITRKRDVKANKKITKTLDVTYQKRKDSLQSLIKKEGILLTWEDLDTSTLFELSSHLLQEKEFPTAVNLYIPFEITKKHDSDLKRSLEELKETILKEIDKIYALKDTNKKHKEKGESEEQPYERSELLSNLEIKLFTHKVKKYEDK